ncbi:hypothetical protein ACH42_00330 [Endozoicomonas sp. (ex Bugula neritina AB1)]|nr:hypothetical protein ACH42_00330 [Endozoicomonas sp. (ex Bugula neritina AB1)]
MKVRDIIFYKEIQTAINTLWDPIGVSSFSPETDEYSSYIPALYKLLSTGANQKQIFEYLWSIETGSMGLSGNREATEKFSLWLCELRRSKKVQPSSKL